MTILKYIFAVIVMTAIYSCSPMKSVIKERTLSSNEVLVKITERNSALKTLRGDGTITVESLEGSNSGSFDVRLKKPDSLRAEFSGPFGIHVGTLSLTRDRFLFYNWMENHALSGTPDGTTLQSVFRLKMKFEEVINAFAGEFPVSVSNDTLSKFYVEDGQYVLVYRTSDGTAEYRVDGDTFIVTSWRMLGADGTSVLNAFASHIEEAGSMSMPMLVRVIFPKERRSVTIAYDDITLNVPVECSFTLPSKAEIIFR